MGSIRLPVAMLLLLLGTSLPQVCDAGDADDSVTSQSAVAHPTDHVGSHARAEGLCVAALCSRSKFHL